MKGLRRGPSSCVWKCELGGCERSILYIGGLEHYLGTAEWSRCNEHSDVVDFHFHCRRDSVTRFSAGLAACHCLPEEAN